MENTHHRIASWWMHWQDLNWPDVDNLDKIKRRADGMARAGVSAAMFFGAHFRWDFMPFFPLLHDYIATVAEELHKNGVKLFDHHSVNLVHRYHNRAEMRHVMMDSGPHLPLSPTFEAAETWEYKGKRLNSWRMIDVKNGKPLYFPQYTAEGFCFRNPEYQEAYFDYVKYLISETGIDGLSADDAMYFMHYNACGCPHCRAEFKRVTGMELPGVENTFFWGNWDNPAWRAWIDMRFDASGSFYEKLRAVLPENFVLTGCGSSSASANAVMSSADARSFLRGWNYMNMELVGNTPPYKHDPMTTNVPIPNRLVNSSHHQAAAKEKGVRAFCTGFAHSTEAANHVWATCKTLDADAWIGTLKMRLGLPWHILNTLPNEEDITGQAFNFEKNHPELFSGEIVGQLGVYYSYETKNHTLFGSLQKGYTSDYSQALQLLFKQGICPHTLFRIPEDAGDYPILILSGVARMAEGEKKRVYQYLKKGGKIVALGPCALAECKNAWQLPNRLNVEPKDFFTTVPDGIHVHAPDWVSKTEIAASGDPDQWSEPLPGLYYHPHRLGESNRERVLALCRRCMKEMPVKLLKNEGYLSSVQRSEDRIVVHLLAADYDVDINHELDKIRYHRSRVNLLTKIEPIGVDREILVETDRIPQVFLPFTEGVAEVKIKDGICMITLPERCSYALLSFPAK